MGQRSLGEPVGILDLTWLCSPTLIGLILALCLSSKNSWGLRSESHRARLACVTTDSKCEAFRDYFQKLLTREPNRCSIRFIFAWFYPPRSSCSGWVRRSHQRVWDLGSTEMAWPEQNYWIRWFSLRNILEAVARLCPITGSDLQQLDEAGLYTKSLHQKCDHFAFEEQKRWGWDE